MGGWKGPGRPSVGQTILMRRQLELAALRRATGAPIACALADWRKIRRQPFSKNSTGKGPRPVTSWLCGASCNGKQFYRARTGLGPVLAGATQQRAIPISRGPWRQGCWRFAVLPGGQRSLADSTAADPLAAEAGAARPLGKPPSSLRPIPRRRARPCVKLAGINLVSSPGPAEPVVVSDCIRAKAWLRWRGKTPPTPPLLGPQLGA